MTPVSTIRLEENLRARSRAAASKRKTHTVKVAKGARKVQSPKAAAESKKLIESAVSPARAKEVERDVTKAKAELPTPVLKGRKQSKPEDFALLPARDKPSYAKGVLEVACPKCGAKPGCPCVHSGGRLGYAHGQRKRAAAAKAAVKS